MKRFKSFVSPKPFTKRAPSSSTNNDKESNKYCNGDECSTNSFEIKSNINEYLSFETSDNSIAKETQELGEAEDRYQALLTSNKRLELEKREIQRQLDMREKEVSSLARRCQSQDDKAKEASKLKATNNELAGQLEGLKSVLSMRDKEFLQIEKLKEELKECQTVRVELRVELSNVKKDHDHVVDNLNACFQKMQRQQEKRQELDDECKRKAQHKELTMEQERIAHLETVNSLKGELKFNHDRIEQLDKLLRDSMTTTADLRRERLDLKASLEESVKLKDDCCRSMEDLKLEHKATMLSMELDSERKLKKSQAALKEKDEVIEALKDDVCTCMNKLMALSEETEKIENEHSGMQHEYSSSMEELKRENSIMIEELAAKDLALAVTNTSLQAHKDERVELEANLKKLEDRVLELEEENAFIMDMEHQLDDMNISILEAQENNSRVEVAFTSTVSDIRSELETKQKMWNELEQELRNKIVKLGEEKCRIEVDLQSKLQASNELVLSLRAELDTSTKEIESLASQQNSMKEHNAKQTKVISELEGKLTEISEEIALKEGESFTLKNQLSAVSEKANTLQDRILCFEAEISSLEEETNSSREKFKTKNEKLVQLQDKVTASQNTVESKDVEIRSLRTQIEDFKTSTCKERSEEQTKHEIEVRSLKEEFSDEMSSCIDRYQRELDAAQELLQQELSAFNNRIQEKENILASLTEKINFERSEKVATIKEMREESEQLKQRSRVELSQAQDLLQQKRGEVEYLQSKLVEMSSKIEQEATSADHALSMNHERVDVLEHELDELRREIQYKSTELERVNTELCNVKEQAKTQIAELYDRNTDQERRIMSLESDLRQERSACDGKECALKTMGIEVENLRQRLSESEHGTLNMEKEIQTLRATRDEYLSERDESVSAQVQKISMLSTELNAKQTMLERLTCELENLKEQIKRKEIEVCEIKDRVSELCASLSSLRDQLNESQTALRISQIRVQDLEHSLNQANSERTKDSKNLKCFQDKIRDLENEASTRENVLDLQREEISMLKGKVVTLENTIGKKSSTLNELRAQLKSTFHETEIERRATEEQHSAMKQIITSLRSDLQFADSESLKKEEEITYLADEIKSMKLEKERQIEFTIKKEQTSKIRAAEMKSIEVELEQKNASLSEEVSNQTAKIFLLNENIAKIHQEAAAKENQQQSSLAAKDAEIAAFEQELNLVRENKILAEEKHQSMIDEKKEIITHLKARIGELQTENEEYSRSSRTEIMSLKQKLQKSEINLAISQDEVRDLKMIDLKEAEETITELESTLHKIRLKAKNDELSKNATMTDMQAHIDQLNTKLSTLEKCGTSSKELHNKTVTKLQSKVSALNGDIETLNLELKDSFRKSNEQHLQITALTARQTELEDTESALRAYIEKLNMDLKKANEEQEKTKILLNREIEKHFANRQEEGAEMQKCQVRLQKELQESRDEVSSLLNQLSEMEELLKSRTKLLADMVSHNKETEGKKDNTVRELAELEKLSQELKHDLEQRQIELNQAKAVFSKKEDQLIDAIQKERELREVTEVELENVSSKLRNWKKDDKEVAELEKENSTLRDKVRRQEAYLKRKLQKDKVLRERSSKSINATPETRIPSLRKPFSTGGKQENRVNLFSGELEHSS